MTHRNRDYRVTFPTVSFMALIFSIGMSNLVAAWGGGGTSDGGFGGSFGGDGCGGCSLVPPELEERAEVLENSFGRLDRDTLLRQRWARELCDNHPCGENVSEDQARELAREFIERAQRREDIARSEERARRDRTVALAGVVIAGLSTLLSMIALWQTYLANRVARSASDRSIRNEALVESWEEKHTRSSKD